jgi:hypothetical protein
MTAALPVPSSRRSVEHLSHQGQPQRHYPTLDRSLLATHSDERDELRLWAKTSFSALISSQVADASM